MLPLHRRQLLTTATAVPALGSLASALPDPAAGSVLRGHGGASATLPDLLGSDMHGHHAGLMHGVPLTHNWAKHPKLDLGSPPARSPR